jgi:hypothetical protein
MTLVSVQLRSTIQSRLNTDNTSEDFTHFSVHISIVTGYLFVETETILTKQIHKIKHSFDVLHAFPPAVCAFIFTPCSSTQTFLEI